MMLRSNSAPIAAEPQGQAKNPRWEKPDVPTTARLRGFGAVNADIVWASGTDGTVIGTLDGGATWSVRRAFRYGVAG
jgi:photosystem II stability/assembly factor-like uncharacterized protein